MDGSVDGSPDGSSSEGGTLDGSLDGATDGSVDGSVDGSTDGATWPDGGSPEEQLALMRQVCHDWGDIVCQAQQDCCMADERRDPSQSECQTRYYLGCDYLMMGAAWTDGRIHFDAAAADAETAAIRALGAACDPEAGTDPSKDFSGTIAVGDDCTPVDAYLGPGNDASALWACDPGLYCKVTRDGSTLHGVCTNLGAEGVSCGSDNDCVATLTCGASSTCETPAADGATCVYWRQCAGGYCDHGVCTSTPHPRWCNM